MFIIVLLSFYIGTEYIFTSEMAMLNLYFIYNLVHKKGKLVKRVNYFKNPGTFCQIDRYHFEVHKKVLKVSEKYFTSFYI